MLRGIEVFFVILGVLLVSIWAAEGNNFFISRWLAPREEQVRRETFEESKAYNDSMVQDIYSMQKDYLLATTPEQKSALKYMIMHRVATYDKNKLPGDLRSFINDLK